MPVVERRRRLGRGFSVVASDATIVTLKAESDGREVAFEPGRSTWMARSVSVYERDRIELAEGDKVRFDRTDLDEGVVNKATGEIAAISDREISFRLGADVVGMSLVPEVISAVHAGFRVVALIGITQAINPDRPTQPSIESMLDAADVAAPRMAAMLTGIVRRLTP